MFSDELEKISWEETTKAIYSKTDADVRRALGKKEHLDVNDFMALISPAAAPYLEVMARLSQKYTLERFGKTISMFVPLYLTNSCTNSCVYCGFHISNPMKRTILTEEEIINEYKAIKRLAPFENLLLVTGENPAAAGVPYIARALDLAKPYFSNLQIEVMPLKAEEYKELTNHGLNGVICFQVLLTCLICFVVFDFLKKRKQNELGKCNHFVIECVIVTSFALSEILGNFIGIYNVHTCNFFGLGIALLCVILEGVFLFK